MWLVDLEAMREMGLGQCLHTGRLSAPPALPNADEFNNRRLVQRGSIFAAEEIKGRMFMGFAVFFYSRFVELMLYAGAHAAWVKDGSPSTLELMSTLEPFLLSQNDVPRKSYKRRKCKLSLEVY